MLTSYEVNGLAVFPVKSIGEVLGLTERQLRTARAHAPLPPAAVVVDDVLRFYDEASLVAWHAHQPVPPVPVVQLVGPKGLAQSAGVKVSTLRSYMRKSLTPTPDFHFGEFPAWYESTRDTWLANRPGHSPGPTSRTTEAPPLEEFLTLAGFATTSGVPYTTIQKRWSRDELPRPDAQIGLPNSPRGRRPTVGWRESTARRYGTGGRPATAETGRGVAHEVFWSAHDAADLGQVNVTRIYNLIHAGRFIRAAAGIGVARGYNEDQIREFFPAARDAG